MKDIVCISPVDGSEVARRRVATDVEIAGVLEGARDAQREWAQVPLAERKVKMLAFLAAMKAQNDAIVPQSPEQGQFSALFACVQAGWRPNAICISEMSRPSRSR